MLKVLYSTRYRKPNYFITKTGCNEGHFDAWRPRFCVTKVSSMHFWAPKLTFTFARLSFSLQRRRNHGVNGKGAAALSKRERSAVSLYDLAHRTCAKAVLLRVVFAGLGNPVGEVRLSSEIVLNMDSRQASNLPYGQGYATLAGIGQRADGLDGVVQRVPKERIDFRGTERYERAAVSNNAKRYALPLAKQALFGENYWLDLCSRRSHRIT